MVLSLLHAVILIMSERKSEKHSQKTSSAPSYNGSDVPHAHPQMQHAATMPTLETDDPTEVTAEKEVNVIRLVEESSKMNSFRRNRRYIDMVLLCNEKRLSAHRLVLACCSPFLEDVLLKDSQIQPFSTLEVEYVDEETMDLLLTYMYKGSMNQNMHGGDTDKILRTIMAGQYLQVTGAPAYFTEQLLLYDGAKLLHANQLWEWAYKFEVTEVRDVVVKHIVHNLKDIVAKNTHLQLNSKCVSAVAYRVSTMNDDPLMIKTMLFGICNWVGFDITNREHCFEELIVIMEKGKISWVNLVKILGKTSLLGRSPKICELATHMVGKSAVRDASKQAGGVFENQSFPKHSSMYENEEIGDSNIARGALPNSFSNVSQGTGKTKTEKKMRKRHHSRSVSPSHREPLPQRSQSATQLSELPSEIQFISETSSNLEEMLGQRNRPVLFLLSCSLDNRLLVHCCRLDSHLWSAAHRLGIASYKDMAVTYHESTLYLIGGEDSASRTKLSMVYAFDVDTQTLRSGPHLRSPRSCVGIVSHGRLLYLLGGKNRWNKALDVVEVFHPGEGWFMTLPRMNERRYKISGAVLQKRLYVFAGHTNKCEMLDLRRPSTAWEMIEPLPEGFANVDTLAVAQHNVVILVRRDQPMRIYCYNPIRNSWRTFKADGASPGPLVNIVARQQHQGGGFWSVDENGKIFTFDPKLNRWSLEVCCPEEAKVPVYLAVEDFLEINKSVSSNL
uniref:BTB domain-containing protein n=1 Tax=Strigamia maritima TaxID=126957 RepID=T1IL30_STRMM